MRLAWAHTRVATLELLRYPSFSIPTLLFPGVLFLLFGGRLSTVHADLRMASYAAFAVLGVAFFQFGVGIAAERSSPWQLFLRILPAPPRVRFTARVVSALAFGFASALFVIALAIATTAAALAPGNWFLLVGTLLGGGVPFALLGIALGYWLSPRGALPLANLLFLALAFTGGLLTNPETLPSIVGSISPYVPTRLWGELLAAAVGKTPFDVGAALLLAAYGASFGLLALWGYRRDEGERFR